jgi:hypothetical protein
MWRDDPLLGNDREKIKYTTDAANRRQTATEKLHFLCGPRQ